MSATDPRAPVYLALVHHPVLNRAREVISTAITNLDVHDIARTARTYGVSRYFIVTPVRAQRMLAEGIVGHWAQETARARVPTRSDALSRVDVVPGIEDAIRVITTETGARPRVVGTSAQVRPHPPLVEYAELRGHLKKPGVPTLLLFGTGYGLADEAWSHCDLCLPPIDPGHGYVHLSVRAALAIIVDRLLASA